ncbi:zinc-binding dehydrogenase [Klebsiella aerogenes]|nr:zinc-binding dehydrogenase [Klebsiella aerogenes]
MIKTDAWLWKKHASPLLLERHEKTLVTPADDQVLIENRAIGLNPVDWKLMAGLSEAWQEDQIPGVDGMGVITAVGRNARHLRPGTRVMYHTDLRFDGSFARHTLVSAQAVIAVPDHISDLTAAALPCPGLTAWQAAQKIPLPAGENVLVSGAGGAAGSLLSQLLIESGANVYVTASATHHAKLLARGVIQAFDYHHTSWPQELKRALAGKSLYAAFDTVNQQNALSLAGLLGYYGHLVCIQDRLEHAPLPAFTTSISLHEVALAAIHPYGTQRQWSRLRQAGENMLQQIGRGELMMPPIESVSFDEIPQALERLTQNNNGIKYVAVL